MIFMNNNVEKSNATEVIIKNMYAALMLKIINKKRYGIIICSKEGTISFSSNKYDKKTLALSVIEMISRMTLSGESFSFVLREITDLEFNGEKIHKISCFVFNKKQIYYIPPENLKKTWTRDKNVPITWRFMDFEYKRILKISKK
jgi:hypothetical protein